MTTTVPAYDTRVCVPSASDVRRDPARCVIKNYIQRLLPWARHITVGARTIRLYDYRCEHNPEGKVGGCAECSGRCLEWATPRTAAKAIRDFDRGKVPTFPAFRLREDEAEIRQDDQDKRRKRAADKVYRARVNAGEIKPNKRSAKAKARAMSDRRKG